MKKTIITAIILTITLSIILVGLCSCSKVEDVNYSLDNNYGINTIDSEDYLIFEPQLMEGASYKYGLIFYVGTFIQAENYTYLGNALAKQGYLAVFSRNLFSYVGYKESEQAFDMYPNVQFFVGGHSQGGGAAIRRAQEMSDKVIGVVLFDPYCAQGRHPLLDENGDIVQDENGVDVYVVETIADLEIPALDLEGNDELIITNAHRDDAYNRLNKDLTTRERIDGGTHIGFADNPSNSSEDFQAQRDYVLITTLAFMQSVVLDL